MKSSPALTPEFATSQWIDKWATYAPNQIALQWDDLSVSLTNAESAKKVHHLAWKLKNETHISAGDRVAILSLNSIEYVLLFFAIQKLGAILIPLNFRLTAAELNWPLQDATPKVLLYEKEFEQTVGKLSQKPAHALCLDDFLRGMDDSPSLSAEDCVIPSADDACMILYTSGTTGRPKGAVITHKMVFWNSINTGLRLNLTQQDVTLTFAPFFHTGGWNVLTTPFLHRGARLILSNKFDPDKVLQLCDDQKVTILFGVPTMMDMMACVASFEQAKLTSVRYAIVGGEPMPVKLIEQWHAKNVPIRQGYGLTEFGPNVFSLNEEDAIRKIGSIGFPNFYIETKVVDDQGKETATNEPGELLLRGPACMKGYWNNEEATARTIVDGWLHTGDIVRKDEEGYFYVMDRKKDMFISGAENVYPAEVEHTLRLIKGVREVAVIGVPDPKWGESGMAFIVCDEDASLTEDAIITFCKERMAKYKIPKHIRFLDELPKSDSGKILKRKLREMV